MLDSPVFHVLCDGWALAEAHSCNWNVVFQDTARNIVLLRPDLSSSVTLGKHSSRACPLAYDSALHRVYTSVDLRVPDLTGVDRWAANFAEVVQQLDRLYESAICEFSLDGGPPKPLCKIPEDLFGAWLLCCDSRRRRLVAHFLPHETREPHRLVTIDTASGNLTPSLLDPSHWRPLLYSPKREAVLEARREAGVDLVLLDGSTLLELPHLDDRRIRGATLAANEEVAVLGGEHLTKIHLETGDTEALSCPGYFPAFERRSAALWAYSDSTTLCRVEDDAATPVARISGNGWEAADWDAYVYTRPPKLSPDGSLLLATLSARKRTAPSAVATAEVSRTTGNTSRSAYEYYVVSVVLDLVEKRAWSLGSALGDAVWVSSSAEPGRS